MEHLDTRTLIDATPVAADMATADYVRLLHPYDAIGKVNFLIADRKDRAESKISEIAAAPFYATCATERTSFVSLNRFHGHREDMRLAALNAVFVDLDAGLFKPKTVGIGPAPDGDQDHVGPLQLAQ